MTNKVLIVDDEADIVNALKIYLSSEGYELYTALSGREALKVIENNDIHLVLLDIMMPGMDGLTLTARIRESRNIPIILLTAKGEESDKVLGLNMGADDYITKPFHPAEVIARVRSQLRRYTELGGRTASPDVIRIGGILLDDRGKSVTVDQEPVSLTPMEYGILKLLMQYPGKVFSSQEIYQLVWKDIPYGSDGVVAVHIRHLREKIEINPSDPKYIKVVWGQGYKMEDTK